ncbi:MAG: redox-regulated ATPase YchF [Candidatus Latescibacteria bacterium]|nr:redox-regulated ATPase YchF [bacterium]MBD3425374.1 redox-regulated ATPase YchF [Candidatus Latescibacterota bacterium]
MSLKVGIIGLPNVGKSTLMNALACTEAEASNYPFCTIESNVGIVTVPDRRLEELAGILHPDEVIPSKVNFVDIAGLVRGASAGEGLGNRFLHCIREVDLLVHVLRVFHDPAVSHVHGDINPMDDLEVVETELFLADLERVEKRIEKEEGRAKAVKKSERRDLAFLEEVREFLSGKKKISGSGYSGHKLEILEELNLLTAKPLILVLNTDEQTGPETDKALAELEASGRGEAVFTISARLEDELNQLPPDERKQYLQELGMERGGLERFILTCHEQLGLIRYYTRSRGKLQAWSIQEGTTAPEAAGRIHSDMESGFIRAKVIRYRDLMEYRSEEGVREHGLLKTEGHDYIIRDGDIIEYLFSG